MTSTEHVIDFDNLVLTSKEVFGDWDYLICENDGYYSEDSQYLYFDFKGIEVIIGFTLEIKGWSWYKPQTYFQPEDGETKITDIFIDVDYLSIADEEINLNRELKQTLEDIVKKYVKYE